jgi:hypothetical protein
VTTQAPLAPGNYMVQTVCPLCGAVEDILVTIGSTLTSPLNDSGTLKPTMKGKGRDHDCRQPTLAAAADPLERHAERVKVQVTHDLLELVAGELPGPMPTLEQIEAWAEPDVLKVSDWAAAVHLSASDKTVDVPPVPNVLREV